MTSHVLSVAKPAVLFAALLSNVTALAQSAPVTPTPPLAFDVVSIHPSKTENVVKGEMEYHISVFRTLDDGYIAENVPILALIADAYHVKPDAITGPEWINSDSYNVSAKITSAEGAPPPKLTTSQRRKMLQALLADRFKLTLNTETKEAAIYELTAAPGGSRLHPAAPANPADTSPKPFSGYPTYTAAGQINADSVSPTSLCDFLTQTLHHPVIDKTALTGKYDFTLKWTPDNTPAESPNAGGPSLFTAVQEQLGLRLETAKGPVTTLLIDHIERPSEN